MKGLWNMREPLNTSKKQSPLRNNQNNDMKEERIYKTRIKILETCI